MPAVVEFRMGEFNFDVQETEVPMPNPDGDDVTVRVRVLVLVEPSSGNRAVIPLPADPPPTGLPEGVLPPAQAVAQKLNGGVVLPSNGLLL